MKYSSIKTLSLGLLLSCSVVLVACDQGSKNTTRATTPVRVTGLPTVGNLGVATVCNNGQSSKGRLYDQNAYSGTFESNIKELVSATFDPAELGSIAGDPNANTGVIFTMLVKLDANARVIGASSNMKLSIYDSYVGQADSDGKIIKPYDITFDTASAGQFDQAGNGTITFKDAYGEVTLVGKLDTQTFTGTATFKNYTSFDGAGNASGDLGVFTIARCGMGL